MAAALVAAALVLSAGCPTRQSDREPSATAWTDQVFLRVGEEQPLDDGRVTVGLPLLDWGDRISVVTVRLRTQDGQVVEETIEAVRNTDYSSAIRLDPYVARVVGYPGVDSATIMVERP